MDEPILQIYTQDELKKMSRKQLINLVRANSIALRTAEKFIASRRCPGCGTQYTCKSCSNKLEVVETKLLTIGD